MVSELLSMLEDSRKDIGRFSPGSEKKRYETHPHKLDGEWDETAEGMMLNFTESGHPVFRASSALERGGVEKQRKRSENHSLHW